LEWGEVGDYLRHRWMKAGGSDTLPFTGEAMERLAGISGGIPRVINTLADNSLLLAFGQGEGTAGPAHVINAANDLGLDARRERAAAKPAAQAREAEYSLRTLAGYSGRPGWWSRFASKGARAVGAET
jgi:hypothetical protein